MRTSRQKAERVTAADESAMLKRFIGAAKGRPLNWTSADQVNKALHTHYSGDDTLSTGDRIRLTKVIEEMQARGGVPAKTLLTECQQAARKAKR